MPKDADFHGGDGRQMPALSPVWVPDRVVTYLAHVEGGTSLRALAERDGCHASTVMRKVRRTEGQRDDPLTDRALNSLGAKWRNGAGNGHPSLKTEGRTLSQRTTDLDDEKLDRDMRRSLRALADPGAMLVIAEGVEDAAVLGRAADDPDRPVRKAVVPREVAELLALNEWISGEVSGRLSRYRITPSGRTKLQHLIAEEETRRADGLEAMDRSKPRPPGQTRGRSVGAEPPLRVLARRKRSCGEPFLDRPMTQAAERFRESYEIARAGGAIGDDIGRLLSGGYQSVAPNAASPGRGALVMKTPRHIVAHESLHRALAALGPELAETVILSCCHEDGMEAIEEKLDYPARSGKIVLRIALGTLARHYAAVGDEGQDLIY
ncbi:DUF6456 domain-containing protein [Maritimibacter sp. DP1N21-5]|uniref:DUF6456 domain-containing protein n=1 Tax=Maritimibacter sp. DP1N21-5 TaxID=2836867 RepID=UPI001C45C303|nr:DUF6456 domain-containing protein [Maritimibacter sp. DP1N21-5]MBV7409829.1 helix-turn-helix domain-containing protein [Maritimibacter sp. DP1N21-5]